MKGKIKRVDGVWVAYIPSDGLVRSALGRGNSPGAAWRNGLIRQINEFDRSLAIFRQG